MNASQGRSKGPVFIRLFYFADADEYCVFTILHLVMMITMSAIAML